MKRGNFLTIFSLVMVAILSTSTYMYSKTSKRLPEFKDVRQETLQFIHYYENLKLLPSEEAKLKRALSGIKAPCCADSSALTC